MRMLVAVAVLAAGGHAVALPPASEPNHYLVVRGTRSGYVDVRFDGSFAATTKQAVTTTLRGTVGGFWAERLNQPPEETPDRFGVVSVRHRGEVFTARVARPMENPAENGLYRPGQYRIHVVADGPFELRVRLRNVGESMIVTPRYPTAKPRVTVTAGRLTAANVWSARQRFSVGSARSVAVSISALRWTGSMTHQHVLCFARPGADCDDDKRLVWNGEAYVSTATTTREGEAEAYWAPPGTVPKGTWDGYQQSVTTPPSNVVAMYGMVVVFPVPAA